MYAIIWCVGFVALIICVVVIATSIVQVENIKAHAPCYYSEKC